MRDVTGRLVAKCKRQGCLSDVMLTESGYADYCDAHIGYAATEDLEVTLSRIEQKLDMLLAALADEKVEMIEAASTLDGDRWVPIERDQTQGLG